MYGTVFNLMGYNLTARATQIKDACVPEYLHNLYNNKEETNARKRLKKLTPEKVLEGLGMKTRDEGCDINQIDRFCSIYKITYYALNYRYEIIQTNNDEKFKNNLPKLVFVCANNHLYPVIDQQQRETVFKTCAIIGNGNKKYQIKKDENDKVLNEETIITLDDVDDIRNYCQENINSTNNIRILTTECHSYFHSEINNGNIWNGNVMEDKGVITQFKMKNITIQHYEENADRTREIIDTLNQNEVKYIFRGQRVHNLANEYWINNYGNIRLNSICSLQVYDILSSRECMNSPFMHNFRNINNKKSLTSYDVKKQYTNILSSCADYGWSVFNPSDEVKPYNGEVKTGLFYIKTNNYFPLKGDGWYFDSVVEKALRYQIITNDDIKYELIPSIVLDKNTFISFVKEVYDKFGIQSKFAINGFIGILGKKLIQKQKTYYESSPDVVMYEMTQNNIEVRSVCNRNELDVDALTLTDGLMDDMIEKAFNSKSDDTILYQLTLKMKLPHMKTQYQCIEKYMM